MNFVGALSEFLTYRFPWWGVCHLRFDPDEKTIYLYCQIPGRREFILKDAMAIAHLDIGISRFIVVHPHYLDFVIECIPRNIL